MNSGFQVLLFSFKTNPNRKELLQGNLNSLIFSFTWLCSRTLKTCVCNADVCLFIKLCKIPKIDNL